MQLVRCTWIFIENWDASRHDGHGRERLVLNVSQIEICISTASGESRAECMLRVPTGCWHMMHGTASRTTEWPFSDSNSRWNYHYYFYGTTFHFFFASISLLFISISSMLHTERSTRWLQEIFVVPASALVCNNKWEKQIVIFCFQRRK